MINQSYQLLLQVLNEKCGPISLQQLSENIALNRGQNWFPQAKEYFNHAPFFQDQNKEIIEAIQKLELPPSFEQKYSLLNVHLFNFAKIKLLFEIHAQEMIDRPENNDQRTNMIKSLEVKLREWLVALQKLEDSHQDTYVHQGPLSASESKEDRLNLMYRGRYVLGQMNLALGQLSRAYYIFKNALLVIQNHMFGYANAEQGKEAENEEQTVTQTGKDQKKAQKEVKETKKGGKETKKEEVQEIEQKLEYLWENLAAHKKRKHLNGFWYIKFKYQITCIFYQQNRFEDCLKLISKFSKDCESLNDIAIKRSLMEIKGRIAIRQGKIKEGVDTLQMVVESLKRFDHQSGRLFGDFGEVMFELKDYAKARGLFQKAYDIFLIMKHDHRFEPIQSINKKPDSESMKVNEKYIYPSDVMDQLAKKEAKIRKDDKRATKDTGKKDNKGQKQQEQLEMKVNNLNALEKIDLTNIQRHQLKDYQPYPPQYLSIYVDFLEDYLRACLRLAACDLALDDPEKVIALLEENQTYFFSNFNLPYSFKLEFYSLSAMAHKRIFVQKVNSYYIPYVEKYLQEKNKKYKKIHDRLPYRDLPRNKYLLDLPNFSDYLKTTLIPHHLKKSLELFNSANLIIKGECIFFENNLKIDELLVEMAELILLQREYFPRLEFKYIECEENEHWQKLAYDEKLKKLNLELESFQILNFAMSVHNCRKEILQTSLGNVNITDVSKIPQDLVNEILESDFIYKKKYDPMLFDEAKNKKLSVNSLDLISLLNKLSNESRLMTFSGHKAQKNIQKIHRFLKSYHTVYIQKCMLTILDITRKADVSVVFIEDGLIKFKSIFCNIEKQYKFIYILSRYAPGKIVTSLEKDEMDKLLITDDKDILYGNFYISSQQLSELELKANDLKQKLQESEAKVQAVKERDFRRLNKDYLDIFNSLGQIFYQRNNSGLRKHAQTEYDVTQDKFFEFIPKLSIANVDTFVKMFGPEGLELENHNLLVIFRNYHKAKYR